MLKVNMSLNGKAKCKSESIIDHCRSYIYARCNIYDKALLHNALHKKGNIHTKAKAPLNYDGNIHQKARYNAYSSMIEKANQIPDDAVY